MIEVYNDEYFMRQALQQAEMAYEAGEIPVGAVVVAEKRIIARAYNQTETLQDVTAHAEMLAITAAANHLGSKYLPDCSLYVTLEPCVMCAGALAWSQVGHIHYAAADEKRGYLKVGKELLHPKTKVHYGLLEAESKSLLQRFFQNLRKS